MKTAEIARAAAEEISKNSGVSVLLHDFGGHAFPIELSRALAADGVRVRHLFSPEVVTGKGRLELAADDPSTLTIEPVNPAAINFVRYSPIARVRWERAYARALIAMIKADPPDVAIICNTQLFALGPVARYLKRAKIPWMLWHHDITSIALGQEAHRKLPGPVAALASRVMTSYEKSIVASADHIVAISTIFSDQYSAWGLHDLRVSIIPNWAPLNEIFPVDRHNGWAQRIGLEPSQFHLLYAGTLGRKHNPMQLIDVLDAVRRDGVDADLTVVSEGVGADALREVARERSDVRVLEYQPTEDFPSVLGSCDVAIAQLEPDASTFSVPSKILAYLAAGRPTVLLAPTDNPAAHTVAGAGSKATTPDRAGVRDASAWITALANDTRRQVQLATDARQYAEAHFNVEQVEAQFQQIIADLAAARATRW